MQCQLRTYSFLSLFLLFAFHTRADENVDKTKDYSKSYTLSSGDRVSLHNEFGKVDVHTWDKNEIKVDVHIKASASTESEADEMLGHIRIDDSKDGDLVRFRTNRDANDHDSGRHHKQSFSIDYTVYLPATQALTLENSFGPITMPDYGGILDITSKFGSLDAGRLSAVKSMHVEFGKANVESVNGTEGTIVVKFSKADLSEVSGQIDADFEFCDVLNLKVASAIKGLKIKNSYTTLHMKMAPGIPATFDISTNFGSLNNHSDYPIKSEDDQDGKHRNMFRKNYSGKSGDGTVNVILHDEFATVDIS